MAKYKLISKYGNEVVNTDDKVKCEKLIDLGFKLVLSDAELKAAKEAEKKAKAEAKAKTEAEAKAKADK